MWNILILKCRQLTQIFCNAGGPHSCKHGPRSPLLQSLNQEFIKEFSENTDMYLEISAYNWKWRSYELFTMFVIFFYWKHTSKQIRELFIQFYLDPHEKLHVSYSKNSLLPFLSWSNHSLMECTVIFISYWIWLRTGNIRQWWRYWLKAPKEKKTKRSPETK